MTDYRALAERLRAYAKDQGGWHNIDDTCEEAASAILALLEERDAKAAYIAARAQDIITLTNLRHEDDSRLAAAESRLAKAVEALRKIEATDWRWQGGGSETKLPGPWGRIARTVLSELEQSE